MDALALQKNLSFLLTPVSVLYGAIMRLRRHTWETSGKRYVCACPCVSVGNIAWGGTGKTPFIEWLVHWAAAEQIRVAVLSRGYRAKPHNPPVLVFPGHQPEEVGDEPLMLARSCPQASVLVDPVRSRAARYAMRTLAPQLVLLDDGFQHLALARNLDLVLLRPEDLLDQWNRIIPAGSWREPVCALERAGAFLFKCSDEAFAALTPAIVERLERFGKPVFSFHLEPMLLQSVSGPETLEAGEFDKPYILVTGVSQPEQVRRTVANYLGREPDECIFRPDHHAFTEAEALAWADRGKPILCTAKDAVKLGRYPLPDVWYLHTTVRFGPGLWTGDTFPAWWNTWWQQACSDTRAAQ